MERVRAVLVGDSRVGKTCFVICYTTNAFFAGDYATVMEEMAAASWSTASS